MQNNVECRTLEVLGKTRRLGPINGADPTEIITVGYLSTIAPGLIPIFGVGINGIVPGTPDANPQRTIRADGTWTLLPGIFSTLAAGLVPAPPDANPARAIRADGTWQIVAVYVVFGVGSNGLVPGPPDANPLRTLRADGSWPILDVFTVVANGLVPSPPDVNPQRTLRADGSWLLLPGVFSLLAAGLVPAPPDANPQRTVRADGSWQLLPGIFGVVSDGLVPGPPVASTTIVLASNGTWVSLPVVPGVFTPIANGLVPAPGAATQSLSLRADGTWQTTPSTAVFSAVADGLVPLSGASTNQFSLRPNAVWTIRDYLDCTTSPTFTWPGTLTASVIFVPPIALSNGGWIQSASGLTVPTTGIYRVSWNVVWTGSKSAGGNARQQGASSLVQVSGGTTTYMTQTVTFDFIGLVTAYDLNISGSKVLTLTAGDKIYTNGTVTPFPAAAAVTIIGRCLELSAHLV